MADLNTIYIKDNHDKRYIIQDIKSFYSHIFKYHASGTSVHDENGYFFTVYEKFRKKIKELYFKNI